MARPRGRATVDAGIGAPVVDTGWPTWADPLAMQHLQDALREGRIGHAYLLSGPKGVGKAEIACAFAQALCCTAIDGTDRSRPCGECRACRNVAHGVHPDVEVFSLDSQAKLADKPTARGTLSIDTVRRLRSSASLFPLEATRRVVIVDDAETLLEPAQQALLKTLEEPPAAVTLLLLTDEPEALLETVRSRCRQITVRPLPEAHVKRALIDRGVDEARAEEIALLSRGCPAWAIAAAADATQLQGRRSERESALSWLMSPEYDRLVTAFKLGEQFSRRHSEVFGVVQATVQVLREQMIVSADRNPSITAGSLFRLPGASAVALSRAVAASLQCLGDLEANVRPRLALEAMVLQWPRWEPNPA